MKIPEQPPFLTANDTDPGGTTFRSEIKSVRNLRFFFKLTSKSADINFNMDAAVDYEQREQALRQAQYRTESDRSLLSSRSLDAACVSWSAVTDSRISSQTSTKT